jgi:hypothetical protein
VPYQISTRAYLERARTRLEEATLEGLFYAAFELRAGIQARVQEYLRVQERVAQRKKEDWQLGRLSRSLDEVFQIGDRIAKVTFYDPETNRLIAVLHYTPVTSELRRSGERLGDLLHTMQQFRSDDDRWWENTRDFLEDVYQQLSTACSGTLLAPLLRERVTNEVVMQMEMFDQNDQELFRQLQPGFKDYIIRVEYIDKLPIRN